MRDFHVCIGLGSNVGNRKNNLLTAMNHINSVEGIQCLKISHFYETAPVGGPPQSMYLNAALSIYTTLTPHELLEQFQDIEARMGRVRTVKWGPRNIDIDILLYGKNVIDDEKLKIPHPLMHTRLFVLKPLIEIEPDIVHPICKKTMLELYRDISNGNEKRRLSY